MRYLTIVPSVSSTLEDPTQGGDDTEDTRHPMTAIEYADRLDYTRRSGTRKWMVGGLDRVSTVGKFYLGMPRILKIQDQSVSRRKLDMNRTCKQRRASAIRRRRNRCLEKHSGASERSSTNPTHNSTALVPLWEYGKPSGRPNQTRNEHTFM